MQRKPERNDIWHGMSNVSPDNYHLREPRRICVLVERVRRGIVIAREVDFVTRQTNAKATPFVLKESQFTRAFSFYLHNALGR